MSHHLIVVHEFGPYKKGDRISFADEVAMVLASPQHTNVNKIAVPDEPGDRKAMMPDVSPL